MRVAAEVVYVYSAREQVAGIGVECLTGEHVLHDIFAILNDQHEIPWLHPGTHLLRPVTETPGPFPWASAVSAVGFCWGTEAEENDSSHVRKRHDGSDVNGRIMC